MVVGAKESVFDEHEHDIADGVEVYLVNLEKARVECSHDVVVEYDNIAWLVN